jgi:hypothetical protein
MWNYFSGEKVITFHFSGKFSSSTQISKDQNDFVMKESGLAVFILTDFGSAVGLTDALLQAQLQVSASLLTFTARVCRMSKERACHIPCSGLVLC